MSSHEKTSEIIAPNLTLDPQGIGGTSTARRVRQSRHRRQLRTLMFVLLTVASAIALGWLSLRPRAEGFAVANARTLPLDLGAPSTLDGQGNVWLTSASGALWRVDANGQSHNYDYVTASRAGAPPLASTDNVKVGGVYVAGLDGRLWKFDGGDKTMWQRDLGAAALATTPAFLRLGNAGFLAVGDSDGRVVGLNARDGVTLWKVYLGGPIGNGIAATRDGFVAPTLASGIWRGGLVSLDGQTGQIKWRFPLGRKMAAGVATPLFDADNNRVYWNNDEGLVASLDASSGRVIWQVEVAPADAPMPVMLRARPVLLGQSLFVGGNDGVLRSLNAGSGKARWNVKLEAPIRALHAANFGGRPAALTVTEREIVLVDAITGDIIERDAGMMAWPIDDGKGAIIVGNDGSWRRVKW